MRDLSFFLFKNSLGSKMKKGFRNSCNGDGSTSTLNQHNLMPTTTSSSSPEKPPTLEEMILQLEFEEEMARRAKQQQQQQLDDDNDVVVEQQYGRMSCVNNSDILRSARNALNQYPRFSLDGKDAMYRSSFRNLDGYNGGRRSVCCDHRLQERLLYQTGYNANNFGGGGATKMEKSSSKCNLPATLGGESVVWCKPGVVAKLMGLEAMPVPLTNTKLLQDGDKDHQQVMMTMKRQNLRRAERHEMERRLAMDMNNNNCDGSRMSMRRRRTMMGSCSKAGYCLVKPLPVEPVEPVDGGGGWPTGRFR